MNFWWNFSILYLLKQKKFELNNEVESVENAYKENNIINEELLQMVEILYYNYKLTDKCPNYYIMMNLLNNSTFNDDNVLPLFPDTFRLFFLSQF